MGEYLMKKEKDFNGKKIYQELDSFYLGLGGNTPSKTGSKAAIDDFMWYAEEPLVMFEEKAEQLKKTHITDYMDNECRASE